MDIKELEEVAQDKHADLQEKEKPQMKNNLKQDEDVKEEEKVEDKSITAIEADAETLATSQCETLASEAPSQSSK